MLRLTVVSWNAQGNKGLDTRAAGSALLGLEPDVVLLQEVQRRQLRALGETTGFAHTTWRFKHQPPFRRAEGLGLLARFPIAAARTQHLARRWCIWDWRRRVAVHASVAVPAAWGTAGISAEAAARRGTGDAHLVNVHLSARVRVAERVRQADLLSRRRWYDAIVAGDLNDDPDSPPLRTLRAAGLRDSWSAAHPDATHPPTNWEAGPRDSPPTQRLDYVLVPHEVYVVDACVPDDWRTWASLSDHLPVVARLRVPSA